MVEGYRVTMPLRGLTESGYRAAGLHNGIYYIIMSLDYLLRVFTLIIIKVIGLLLILVGVVQSI